MGYESPMATIIYIQHSAAPLMKRHISHHHYPYYY